MLCKRAYNFCWVLKWYSGKFLLSPPPPSFLLYRFFYKHSYVLLVSMCNTINQQYVRWAQDNVDSVPLWTSKTYLFCEDFHDCFAYYIWKQLRGKIIFIPGTYLYICFKYSSQFLTRLIIAIFIFKSFNIRYPLESRGREIGTFFHKTDNSYFHP